MFWELIIATGVAGVPIGLWFRVASADCSQRAGRGHRHRGGLPQRSSRVRRARHRARARDPADRLPAGPDAVLPVQGGVESTTSRASRVSPATVEQAAQVSAKRPPDRVEGHAQCTGRDRLPSRPSLITALAALGSAQAQTATACANPRGIGVSRVIEVDATGGPRFGVQFSRNSLLNDGEVILTFDDGPLQPYTQQVLAALADSLHEGHLLHGRQDGRWPIRRWPRRSRARGTPSARTPGRTAT